MLSDDCACVSACAWYDEQPAKTRLLLPEGPYSLPPSCTAPGDGGADLSADGCVHTTEHCCEDAASVAALDALKTAKKDYLEGCPLTCGMVVAGSGQGSVATAMRASTFAVLAVAAVGMMAAN